MCLLEFFFLMKTVNGCKDVYNSVCSQSINKQIVNIVNENLKDYSFLSRYDYTKSNYFKR